MYVLFENPKLIENNDYSSLQILESEGDFVVFACNKEILIPEEKKFVEGLDRNYVIQLIYNYLERFTIQKIAWKFGTDNLGVSISTKEGVFLYLENLDFSFQKVLIAMQDKYDEQMKNFLCNNPNLQEVYFMKPNDSFSSFDVYQDNKIFVLKPMLYNGKLKTTDNRLIQQFFDSLFATSCKKITIEELFWEKPKGINESLKVWKLQKENLLVYFQSTYYTYIKSKLQEQEEQGMMLYRKLD